MVRPMLASAEPSARFRLVCSRLAARPAPPPGSRAAAPAPRSRCRPRPSALRAGPRDSIVGVSALARPTTATSATSSSPALTSAVRLDGGGACVPRRALERQEVVAVPHGLHEHERAVEHQRHHAGEDQLRRGEDGPGAPVAKFGRTGSAWSARPAPPARRSRPAAGIPARDGARRPRAGTARRCRCR